MRALRGFGLVLLSCVASPALAGSGAFDSPGPFVLDGGDIEAEALAAPPPVLQGPPAPRPVAFEYSDGYYKRLKVHRIASYATLPLFATQVVLGQKPYGNDYSQGTKDAHTAVAIATATLFGVNTVTGVMNLWEARKDPNASRRKKVHGILMLASSAGFVATGLLAPAARRLRREPRAVARGAARRRVADGGGVKDGCGDCGGRRAAVGRISAATLAALAGVTPPPGSAGAYPVVEATGTAKGGEERRLPLPASDGVTIDREAQVILVRFGGKVYAFNLACPHENTALRWRARDVRFQCPRHESQYQPDGTFIRGRATRNMDRFAVRREGGDLVIDLGRLYRSDESPREWAAAFVPA